MQVDITNPQDNVVIVNFREGNAVGRWPGKISPYGANQSQVSVFYVPLKEEYRLENIIVPPEFEFVKENGKLIFTVSGGGKQEEKEYKFNRSVLHSTSSESIPLINLKGGYAFHAVLEFADRYGTLVEPRVHEAQIHLQFVRSKIA